MTKDRRAKIIELVAQNEIGTQKELLEALCDAGFVATQATVSRDISILQITKGLTSSGKRCYMLPKKNPIKASTKEEVFLRLFKESVVSIELSMNLIVLKTLNSAANAAAEAIDQAGFSDVVGTIAGDNTVFVATPSPEAAEEIASQFSALLHS